MATSEFKKTQGDSLLASPSVYLPYLIHGDNRVWGCLDLEVLGVKCRASCKLATHSMPELHFQAELTPELTQPGPP